MADATERAALVLVETAAGMPGLVTFAGWQALTSADAVVARDPEGHPSAPYLHQAGIPIEPVEPAGTALGGLDLLAPGSPGDRGLARALCDLAAERGRVAVLRDAGDAELARAIGLEAAKRHLEVEFVFLDAVPPGTELLRLVEVERRLRAPEGGCPWDLEQDHASLARYLVEETYELLDAIDSGDDDHLREELGDVLLQVVFHAQIATDRRAFSIDDVAAGIADKLVRRHPHVFGDTEVADAAEVRANWETLKQDEKGREGPFDGVPMALPALQLANDLQRKAARTGFDWDDLDGPVAQVRSELDELLAASDETTRDHELGDLLAAVVALARALDLDAEGALRRHAQRFRLRVEGMLDLARQRDLDTATLDADGWSALWDESKARHG
jgi:MazG family protein